MLDWSSATIGPPAIDVAVMVLSLSFGAKPAIPADELVSGYTEGLRGRRVKLGAGEVDRSARNPLRLLIRATVGWAGLVADPQPTGRTLALRDSVAARVAGTVAWLDG